jgi:hypothetical protein
VPAYLVAMLILFFVVFGGIGFLFLRWPQAGAKSMQAFRDQLRPLIPWPISIRTARLLGVEFAVAGLASAIVLVYFLISSSAWTTS